MPVRINGLNTGSVTLSASANGGDVTLNLPNANGTVATTSYADTAPGLQYITGQTFTAASAVSVNNCFTSTYENYRVLLAVTGLSADLSLTGRLRTSGSDNTTSNYVGQRIRATSTTAAAIVNNATSSWDMGSIDGPTSAFRYIFSFDIYSPQVATRTLSVGTRASYDSTGAGVTETVWLSFEDVTQFDGLSVIASTGNITGTIRVYGYRNL